MQIYSIPAEHFKSDGGALFGTVPKSIWQKLVQADELNLCNMVARCLLVEDGDRLILIDAGIGNKQEEKYLRHFHLHGEDSIEKSLQQYGLSCEDITDVLLTHLHFDHVGGVYKKNEESKIVPTFPNAVIWSNQQQWDWATLSPNIREKASFLDENLLPLQSSGQLRMLPCQDGLAFTKNIKIRFVNGHTRAMMLPQINCNNQTFFFTADLIPFAAHLPINYLPAFDVSPLDTIKEKKQFLQEIVENDYILFFEHDPLVECATLQITEKGICIKETFNLAQYK